MGDNLAFTRNEKFPFLNERLSREPHIEEILTEIDFLQKNWIKNKAGELATAAYLNRIQKCEATFDPEKANEY